MFALSLFFPRVAPWTQLRTAQIFVHLYEALREHSRQGPNISRVFSFVLNYLFLYLILKMNPSRTWRPNYQPVCLEESHWPVCEEVASANWILIQSARRVQFDPNWLSDKLLYSVYIMTLFWFLCLTFVFSTIFVSKKVLNKGKLYRFE